MHWTSTHDAAVPGDENAPPEENAFWYDAPARQQPTWDPSGLRRAVDQLRAVPPLVDDREVGALREELAAVSAGERFLIQGGDCAETFAGNTGAHVRATVQMLKTVATIVGTRSGADVTTIGRMAGQYAKPRSSDVDEHGLPSYRGDIINAEEPDAEQREADPARLVWGYANSAATLNQVRALDRAGWGPDDIEAVETALGPWLGSEAAEDAWATDVRTRLQQVHGLDWGTTYVSHEALAVPYEAALIRDVDPLLSTGTTYASSGHFTWIGDRTRQPGHAHVRMAQEVWNPVGVKLGPSTTPDQAAEYVRLLNPNGIAGRLTLICRMGSDQIDELLPGIVAAVQDTGIPVVWQSDPMHGNTVKATTGRKTRPLARITSEIEAFFRILTEAGEWPGGVHLEATGENITECTGGVGGLTDDDLERRYETTVDPRLNAGQAAEVAALTGRLVAEATAARHAAGARPDAA